MIHIPKAEYTRRRKALMAQMEPNSIAILPAAAVAMRPDGSIDFRSVVASMLRQPGQIPALVRTGRNAGRAFRALGRVRGLLGPDFGLHL